MPICSTRGGGKQGCMRGGRLPLLNTASGRRLGLACTSREQCANVAHTQQHRAPRPHAPTLNTLPAPPFPPPFPLPSRRRTLKMKATESPKWSTLVARVTARGVRRSCRPLNTPCDTETRSAAGAAVALGPGRGVGQQGRRSGRAAGHVCVLYERQQQGVSPVGEAGPHPSTSSPTPSVHILPHPDPHPHQGSRGEPWSSLSSGGWDGWRTCVGVCGLVGCHLGAATCSATCAVPKTAHPTAEARACTGRGPFSAPGSAAQQLPNPHPHPNPSPNTP